MACPFFVPVAPWSDNGGESWCGARRVPLGEPYRGSCSLTGEEADPRDQAALCNFGYARGRCSHFPDSDVQAPDALRFSITGVTGETVRLVWIAERDHAPRAHGASEERNGEFEPEIPVAFRAQARAFVRTYRGGRSPQGSSAL